MRQFNFPQNGNINAPTVVKHPLSLLRRTVTALISIPIVLTILCIGGWVLFVALVFVLVIMTTELRCMLQEAGHRPNLMISLFLGLLLLVSAMFPQQRLIILEVGFSLTLLISFPAYFLRNLEHHPLNDWGITLGLALYEGWPLSCLLLLRGTAPFPLQTNFWNHIPRGLWWVLLLFLATWGFETGAFYIGKLCRYIGQDHALAPLLSPGKNWEGLLGGTLLSVIICLILGMALLGIPWYLALLLGILLGITAMGGDLSESFIKREAHVKDSGVMFPGHGGLLDRSDSLLFGTIVVYLFMLLIGT